MTKVIKSEGVSLRELQQVNKKKSHFNLENYDFCLYLISVFDNN